MSYVCVTLRLPLTVCLIFHGHLQTCNKVTYSKSGTIISFKIWQATKIVKVTKIYTSYYSSHQLLLLLCISRSFLLQFEFSDFNFCGTSEHWDETCNETGFILNLCHYATEIPYQWGDVSPHWATTVKRRVFPVIFNPDMSAIELNPNTHLNLLANKTCARWYQL